MKSANRFAYTRQHLHVHILYIAVARMDSMGNTVRSTLTSVTPTPAKIMASALMESIHIPANAQLIGLERIANIVSYVFDQISNNPLLVTVDIRFFFLS